MGTVHTQRHEHSILQLWACFFSVPVSFLLIYPGPLSHTFSTPYQLPITQYFPLLPLFTSATVPHLFGSMFHLLFLDNSIICSSLLPAPITSQPLLLFPPFLLPPDSICHSSPPHPDLLIACQLLPHPSVSLYWLFPLCSFIPD